MTPPPLDDDYLHRFSEAVVQEVWNEMGRQRIRSIRELARRADLLPQYLTSRLNVDPKTKKPVTINVRDLAVLGEALGLAPVELLERAQAAIGGPVPAPIQLDEKRAAKKPGQRRERTVPPVQKRAARKSPKTDED